MNGYTLAIVAVSFAPSLICIGVAARIVFDGRDLSPAGAGFGWAGFILGGGALALAQHIIDRVLP